MFSNKYIEDNPSKNIYDINCIEGGPFLHPNELFDLITYVIIKFIFFILSMTLPLPNGIFAPMISFGAVFGRMFGRSLYLIG
jgi:H+/Cl- antiporter ClcA